MLNDNKNEEFRGQAIVCFIDILGFSDDIKNNWDKPKSDPDHPLNKILAIKKLAKEFADNMAVTFDAPLNQLSHRSVVTSISDSFVIRFGFEDEVTSGNPYFKIGFASVMWTAMGIWIACILYGYTIRGAVDLGDVYWNENSIIGKTFINVYELETKVVKNSRIIISSNLNDKLKHFFTEFHPENSAYQNALIECLRKDVDGYIMFDPKLMLLGKQENERDYFIEKILAIKKSAIRDIDKEKYTPLIHMLKNDNSTPLTYADFGLY